MKHSVSRRVSIPLIALLSLSIAAAQVSPEKIASAPTKIAQPLPFKSGETLVYEVNFSRFIFSGTIGELKLSVSDRTGVATSEVLELNAEAVSKGFFPSLFGIKVKDRYNSLVDRADFGLRATTKLLDEGKVHREQKSLIEREVGRVTYTDR